MSQPPRLPWQPLPAVPAPAPAHAPSPVHPSLQQPLRRHCPGLRLHTPATATGARTQGIVFECRAPLAVGEERCKTCSKPKRRRQDQVLRTILMPDWERRQATVLQEPLVIVREAPVEVVGPGGYGGHPGGYPAGGYPGFPGMQPPAPEPTRPVDASPRGQLEAWTRRNGS